MLGMVLDQQPQLPGLRGLDLLAGEAIGSVSSSASVAARIAFAPSLIGGHSMPGTSDFWLGGGMVSVS